MVKINWMTKWVKLAHGPEKSRINIDIIDFFVLIKKSNIKVKTSDTKESTYVKTSEHKVDVFL